MTTAEALENVLPAEAMGAPTAGAVAGAECVVRPGSTAEAAAVMSWASRAGVGVLPLHSGRRTATVVGEGRWIGLSSERLEGIEIYEAADLTMTAGAGTSMRVIAEALAANGQWAPFDPPAVESRSLGGLVADGRTGPLWMGYGEMRNHVLGMTVVTGDGRTLRLGGRVVKNVAGYDLIKPMTGSRGTLSVITSVCLRAFPRPAEDRVLVLRSDEMERLVEAAIAVGTAPVLPVSCVLVDRADALAGSGALVARLHGAGSTVDADQRSLEAHLGRALEKVEDDVAGVLLGQLREHASEGPTVVAASAAPSRLPQLLAALSALVPSAVAVDSYGGRARISCDAEADAVTAAARAVEVIGGALRISRAPDARTAASGTKPSGDEARLTDRIREAFDPEGVLWPARG